MPNQARLETVETTSLSVELERMKRTLADIDVVNSRHVEAVKLAISEGRLQVDSEAVADRLLGTVREYMLTQQKKKLSPPPGKKTGPEA